MLLTLKQVSDTIEAFDAKDVPPIVIATFNEIASNYASKCGDDTKAIETLSMAIAA